MHQKINSETGKTTYDVVDGKQRLTSIIRFTKGEIDSASENENSPLYDERLEGVSFQDLSDGELKEYLDAFWRYTIPVEYVDTENKEVVDAIFDRLNRNGEPLEGQELRRAKYHDTQLLLTVENLCQLPFWVERLSEANVEVKRLEDREFISEILFFMLSGNPMESNQEILDKSYEKLKDSTIDWSDIALKFEAVTNYMSRLNLDYKKHKIVGVSHFYGIWGAVLYAKEKGLSPEFVGDKLSSFYETLRESQELVGAYKEYKNSMASATRGKTSRNRRVNALVKVIG